MFCSVHMGDFYTPIYMNAPTAFLFDLNGTMVNDMDFHITAWHEVFNNWGAEITWDHMKVECYGKNEEIVQRLFPARFNHEEVQQMAMQKEMQYRLNYQPHLELLPGLDLLLHRAHNDNINMAIGSASIKSNIDFVVDGLELSDYFHVIVSAEDVQHSKPHPETFLLCAEWLHVEASACIVFEDSIKGVEAALRAGMRCIAITNLHGEKDFAKFPNVLLAIEDYNDPRLTPLLFEEG